ncbi:MAG: TraY domain-containing protein [Chitinivibrionales bacterium]|nr:TraY domain-containing protein [Chitinivibrionales bacterium]
MNTITVRLDKETGKMLALVCKRNKRNKSDVVRDALKRQLSIQMFNQLRKEIMPFAEARGYLVDEDVFKEVS